MTKLRPGQQRYYLATAASRDEGGEGSGWWAGAGAASLGLAGVVDGCDLAELLTPGLPPRATRVTPATIGRRRNPGFDLTFSAPKSVSVLAGLGSDGAAHEVQAAHRAALVAAIGYLERDAARAVRAGRPVPVRGVVAATFDHRVSRLADPHTHSHVLVANLVEGPDGRWSALDARGLYLHAATAGALYHAHMRFELGQRLGVTFGPVIRGVAQVEGIDPSVCRAFSRRRRQVEEALVARGAWTPKAAQVAALRTRTAKARSTPPDLQVEWRRRADRLGFGVDERRALESGRTVPPPGRAQLDRRAERVLGACGVTSEASTFSRRDVIRAWCDLLPEGLPVAAIESLVTASLSRSDVRAVAVPTARRSDTLRLAGGRIVPGVEGEARFTTAAVLDLESGLAEAASSRISGWPSASPAAVQRALAERPGLGAAPSAAVARIGCSGRGMVLLDTGAGADRLGVLDALRAAWAGDGLVVTGVSADGRGAAELAAFAGIHPPVEHGSSPPRLAPGSVLVVDGADRLGTRRLAEWVDAAGAARATVVLVATRDGPDAVDRSGAWRALRTELGVEVATVRELPSRELRSRAVAEAGSRIRVIPAPDGSVVLASTGFEARDRLVADWFAARQAGGAPSVMVAARRREADDLNHAARELLREAGTLQGSEWVIGGRAWRTGDLALARLVQEWQAAAGSHAPPDQPTSQDPAQLAAIRDRLGRWLLAEAPPPVAEHLARAEKERAGARQALAEARSGLEPHWRQQLATAERRVEELRSQAERRRSWIVQHGPGIAAYAAAREGVSRWDAGRARARDVASRGWARADRDALFRDALARERETPARHRGAGFDRADR